MPDPTDSDRSADEKAIATRPVVTFSYGKNVIELSYFFPGQTDTCTLTSGSLPDPNHPDSFNHEVGISGAGFFSQSGRPLLPSFGRFVQIPADCRFSVAFETGDLEKIEGCRIRPAQENAMDQEEFTVEFEEDFYRQDRFYPDKIVAWNGPHCMDAYRAICLHVRPVQYNPLKKRLLYHHRIKVSITLMPGSLLGTAPPGQGEPPPWVFSDATKDLKGFGNLMFNPDRTAFQPVPVFPPQVGRSAVRPETPELCIIYGKDLEKPAQRLKAWKQRRGLETGVVPLAGIVGSADTDNDRIDRLKAYIREKRQKPFSPLRYVLMMGDVNEIPTETVGSNKTDHYFYTHRDAGTAECILPWVSGGRIPVGNRKDAMAVVNQIMHYEKNPPLDPDYFQRLTVAAYYEDVDRSGRQDGMANMAYVSTMERIRDHMMARGFTVNRVYVTNNPNPVYYCDGSTVPAAVKEAMFPKSDGNIATKQLISRINEGPLLVGHRGHGDKSGWLQPPFGQAQLTSLSNSYPSVFFSINCRTGSFQRLSGGCFADDILKSPGTAPSLIAATANSGSWRNDSMIRALFDAIWPGIIPTFPPAASCPVRYHRMGDLLNYAKAFLLVSHDVNDMTKKQFEIYHVIGDPTLELWGDVPERLKLHTRIWRGTLLVNMNTCPEDAVLSIWRGKTRLLRIEPSVPRLAIPLALLEKLPADALDHRRETPYAITVCLYAPGHRFAESTLWY